MLYGIIILLIILGFMLWRSNRRIKVELSSTAAALNELEKDREKNYHQYKEKKQEELEEQFELRREQESQKTQDFIGRCSLERASLTNEIKNLKLQASGLVNEIELKKKNVDAEIALYRSQTQTAADRERDRILSELKIAEEKDKSDLTIKRREKLEELAKELELFERKFQDEKEKIIEEKEACLRELEEFRAKRTAVNEAALREREIQEKENFYKICLSAEDIEDIELLKSMAPRLRHRELLPKLIWDALISRPTSEMIKRVAGTGGSGIYKITYLPTGEAYIGKTTDFKTRWKNHISTALGLEKAASSTLHTHMAAHGLQNYTFEILERIEKDKLGEREKYWIDFYGTKENGLNMKNGG